METGCDQQMNSTNQAQIIGSRMAEHGDGLLPAFEQIASRFLNLNNDLLSKLGIIAVIAGGSLVYDHAFNGTLDQARDLDSAMLVRDTRDLAKALTTKRTLLTRVLLISREECPGLPVPPFGSADWTNTDGVRFAGFTESGLKKSVKIVAADPFTSDRRTVNIISYKDKRVYKGATFTGLPAFRMQQATRLASGLSVLHDPWTFRDTKGVEASFGVTADLLMTGAWIRGEDPGIFVRARLLAHAESIAGIMEAVGFTRNHRFSAGYRHWLTSKLEIPLLEPVKPDRTKSPSMLFGEAEPGRSLMRFLGFSNDLIFGRTAKGELDYRLLHVVETPFSNNADNTIITVRAYGRSQSKTDIVAFSKEAVTSQQLSECQGTLQAARLFSLVQQPIAECGRLLYPYFQGTSEAEAQLEYYRGGSDSSLQLVLDVEMRKAEDTLNAYRWSLRPTLNGGSIRADWQIHRFFHDRLQTQTRLRAFYGAGVTLNEWKVDLDDFLTLPISINGRRHPPLAVIHGEAERRLHPARFQSRPVAFGLGDAHGGNIMIEEHAGANAARRILYIDYEVSGYHSPVLDVAKPFYNDIFFPALYADCIDDPPVVDADIHDGTLHLNFAGRERTLAKAVLNIKRKYLIEPLLLHSPETSIDTAAGVATLANALFACALLTRNFSDKPEAFLVAVYHAVLLSQIKTLGDLWRICDELLSGPDADET